MIKPLNFENPEEIAKLVNQEIENNRSIEELGIEGVKVDLLDIVLHPIYSVLWTVKARYKYTFGSKDNGKSFQNTLRLVTKWLSHPKRNAVVLRKYSTYNASSTLPDVVKIMAVLAKVSGIPNLVPVTAEDYRRGGKKDLFYYTKTSPIELHNSVTNQKIIFTGLDRIASGGLSLFDTEHAIDTIWAEELVDVEENGAGEIMDDTSFQKWRVIESTIFRGTREAILDENGNEIGQKRRKGLEWVDEEILFSFNSHNPDHWLLKEIGDKFVPLNPLDRDDCEDMEKSIVRTYYDKDFQGGEGILVMRTSVYLNGGRDVKLIEQMREDDFMSYAYLYLGATKAIGGLAYSGYEGKIHVRNLEQSEMLPLSIGIDHANSPDHGDWFAATFLATDIATNQDSMFPGWGYPGFNKMYFYDEYGWNNKELEFKTDETFSEEVLSKLVEYVENNENWAQHIKKHGFMIIVDNSAGSFMQTLSKKILELGNLKPYLRPWLGMIRIVPVEGKNVMVEIDGIKQKARKARVERNKRLLQNDMIVFDPKCYKTRQQFLQTAYDKKMEVVDKHRDFVDSMDYSSMIPLYQNIFNQTMLRKEKINKNRD